ncbi:MAG: hypothetical protein AB7F86_14365 [Bdellovibrionales bacterium]
MKNLVLATLFLFSGLAAAIGDDAPLNGNPLHSETLDIFSLLVEHRSEIENLFKDNHGQLMSFWQGTVSSEIKDSTLTERYALSVKPCGRTELCDYQDNLIIEKVTTQQLRGQVTTYKLSRSQGEFAGREIREEALALATIYLNHRGEINIYYDGDSYQGVHFWHTRGVYKKKTNDPSTTVYDLEAGSCGEPPFEKECYWTHTLKIEETGAPSGSPTYKFSSKGSGLG